MHHVLPTPEWFAKEVQKEINTFLWDGKPPKIKFLTAISDFESGGIKLTHIENYIKSQKAIWTKRLLQKIPPSEYLSIFLPDMKLCDLLLCSVNPNDLSTCIPNFYRQTLHAWYSYTKMRRNEVKSPLTEVLWFNEDIKVNNSPVFYQEWYNKEVLIIQDLVHDSMQWLKYDEFVKKYSIKCEFFS